MTSPRTPTEPTHLTPTPADMSEGDTVELLKAALAPSFVLIRRLGAGGMGIVYLARDPALKRLVAVKVMSPERAADQYARARFEREAEAVAAISHPNVVAVHGVGELANGIPYIVMQYVDGPSMAEKLKAEGPLDLDLAKAILGQVASALAAAHRKGVIHRDIKAANILWDDATGRALVSDFGIAAVDERRFDSESIRLTQTGMMMGTPAYMSPEQFLGEQVTDKVDIYSLGLLGFELLTGEGPYQVTSPQQLPAAHLRDAPRLLSALRPDAEPELETLLANCLEKMPDARPTAEDVSRRLARGASVLLEWPPPGTEELHGAARRPVSLLIVGAFGVAIPMVVAATTGEDSMLAFTWPQVMIWPLASLFGVGVSVLATLLIDKTVRVASKAAKAGYGWGTIAEVLVDERRDTGALITGEREYAALLPAKRDEFRRARVLREALRLGAALWCILGFFIGVPLAVRALASPRALAFWTLGIPVLMLVLERILASREARAVAGVRAKLDKARSQFDRLGQLATTWRQSFDQISAGLRAGQGFFGRVRRIRLTSVLLAGAVAVGGAASVGVMLLAPFEQVMQQYGQPNEGFVTGIYRDATRMQRYRPAVDPSITPLRAGQAMWAISATVPRTLPAIARKPVRKLPIMHSWGAGAGPFNGNWLDGAAIRQVRQGLSPAQRQYLTLAANQPGIDEFTIVARARSVDLVAALLPEPVPANFSPWMIPRIEPFPIRAIAYGRIGQAALDLADGHPALAESRLRDVVGVGFGLMDSRRIGDNMVGAALVRRARANLIALLEATGRSADAAAIAGEEIAPGEQYTVQSDMRMTPMARAAHRQSVIRDSTAPPGLRWDIVRRLAFEPCGDLRQMLFGPDPTYAARMAQARRALVRLPGDEILMRYSEQVLNTVPTEWQYEFLRPSDSMLGFVRETDAIAGTHFTSCLMNPGPM